MSGELPIDGSIQRKNLSHLEGRDLQSACAWLVPDPDTETSLCDENKSNNSSTGNGNHHNTGKWDQFEINSRLFNVNNSYQEDLYTKKQDVSKMTKDQICKAERLAREIETTTTENIHLQEVKIIHDTIITTTAKPR